MILKKNRSGKNNFSNGMQKNLYISVSTYTLFSNYNHSNKSFHNNKKESYRQALHFKNFKIGTLKVDLVPKLMHFEDFYQSA